MNSNRELKCSSCGVPFVSMYAPCLNPDCRAYHCVRGVVDLTAHQLDQVWSYVFTRTMRERASIPGSASEPENRFRVAVAAADEAVSTPKAARGWLWNVNNQE